MIVILLGAKSVVVAGVTLLLLRLMHGRSASDRSWIAHLGLAALAVLPLGSMLFPPLEVRISYAFVLDKLAMAGSDSAWIEAAAHTPAKAWDWPQVVDWLLLAYFVVALFLIARTLLSLLRVVVLTMRAHAVADDHWLQALTLARQRIEFTKCVALLATREIASPVSWGVLQPKILLNIDAVAVRADADAIMAHELAHIARADWAKLVLARVSVAIFWFNPFAWLLAREAHQLREEAADDAALATDVEDTAYASLLVNTVRTGLLHGAHGVAPAGSSLAKRVRRILDRSLNRSPGSTLWAVTMGLGAIALTVPLLTLQLTDAGTASSVSAPLVSDDDAKVILFDLRMPPQPKSPPPEE